MEMFAFPITIERLIQSQYSRMPISGNVIPESAACKSCRRQRLAKAGDGEFDHSLRLCVLHVTQKSTICTQSRPELHRYRTMNAQDARSVAVGLHVAGCCGIFLTSWLVFACSRPPVSIVDGQYLKQPRPVALVFQLANAHLL